LSAACLFESTELLGAESTEKTRLFERFTAGQSVHFRDAFGRVYGAFSLTLLGKSKTQPHTVQHVIWAGQNR
ncbi:MAG: hypothetical protein AAFV30_10670, partial [Pseudomonadota bacterium]